MYSITGDGEREVRYPPQLLNTSTFPFSAPRSLDKLVHGRGLICHPLTLLETFGFVYFSVLSLFHLHTRTHNIYICLTYRHTTRTVPIPSFLLPSLLAPPFSYFLFPQFFFSPFLTALPYVPFCLCAPFATFSFIDSPSKRTLHASKSTTTSANSNVWWPTCPIRSSIYSPTSFIRAK